LTGGSTEIYERIVFGKSIFDAMGFTHMPKYKLPVLAGTAVFYLQVFAKFSVVIVRTAHVKRCFPIYSTLMECETLQNSNLLLICVCIRHRYN